MKKPSLIISHLVFWTLTVLSTPYVFFIAFWRLTHHLQHPNATAYPEKYYLEIDYPALTIISLIGACIFYSSYFSLNFFVKRPIRFLLVFGFYLSYELVFSLPADLFSESATRDLGPILYFNLCGFLFKACVEWIKDRKIRLELEKDRETSQLELLKSKIDPHFLYKNRIAIEKTGPGSCLRRKPAIRVQVNLFNFLRSDRDFH